MTNVTIDAISLAVAVMAMAVAAATDLKSRRVPNLLTFPCMAIGLALTATTSPKDAVLRFVIAIAVAFTSVLGMMGMGDLKLIMAIVCLRGLGEATWCVFFGAMAMIGYCLAFESDAMIGSLKDTFAYLTIGKPIARRSDVRYPFATFMAVAYPLAWMVARIA